jgi:hypothetical protein
MLTSLWLGAVSLDIFETEHQSLCPLKQKLGPITKVYCQVVWLLHTTCEQILRCSLNLLKTNLSFYWFLVPSYYRQTSKLEGTRINFQG